MRSFHSLLIIAFLAFPHLIFSQHERWNNLLPPKALKNNSAFIKVIDSVYYWKFDTASQNWNAMPYQRTVNITYDASYNRTGSETQVYNAGMWINAQKEINTYNASNDLLIVVQQAWNGSSWENTDRTSYTYDLNHNILSMTEQVWSGSAWNNDVRNIYTYNANNDILTHEMEFYSSGAWENAYLTTNTYDSNNNRLTYMYQSWDGMGWVNEELTTSTYDSNNNLLTEVFQSGSGTSWTNFRRSNFTYVGNNLMERLNEIWDMSAWNPLSKIIYDYDVNNNCLSATSEMFSSGSFMPTTRILYAYDLQNRKISEVSQSWNSSSWEDNVRVLYSYTPVNTQLLVQSWNGAAWTNSYIQSTGMDADGFIYVFSFKTWSFSGSMINSGDSLYLYYHTVTAVEESRGEQLFIYPNPAQNHFTVVLPHAGDVAVEVYDAFGKKVMSERIYNIDLSFSVQVPQALDAGDYCVRLQAGKKLFTSNLLIVR